MQSEYALRYSNTNEDIDKSIAFSRCFLPGQHINMSMVFDTVSDGLSSCPGCKLTTSRTEEELNAQVQW